MCAFCPSGKISNAVLTFSNFLDISSAHKLCWLLAFRVRAFSTFLGSSMPKLSLFFRYLVCSFLTLATILSHFLCTCSTHQTKAGLLSIPCATANSAVSTRWDSFHLNNFCHEEVPSFHWQQICQPSVDYWATGLPCILVYWEKWPCYSFDNQLANPRVSTNSCLHHNVHKIFIKWQWQATLYPCHQQIQLDTS